VIAADKELAERVKFEQLLTDEGGVGVTTHPDLANGRYELAIKGRVVVRVDLSPWKVPPPREPSL